MSDNEQDWEGIYADHEAGADYAQDEVGDTYQVEWEAIVWGTTEIMAGSEEEAEELVRNSGEGVELEAIHEILDFTVKRSELL